MCVDNIYPRIMVESYVSAIRCPSYRFGHIPPTVESVNTKISSDWSLTSIQCYSFTTSNLFNSVEFSLRWIDADQCSPLSK